MRPTRPPPPVLYPTFDKDVRAEPVGAAAVEERRLMLPFSAVPFDVICQVFVAMPARVLVVEVGIPAGEVIERLYRGAEEVFNL